VARACTGAPATLAKVEVCSYSLYTYASATLCRGIAGRALVLHETSRSAQSVLQDGTKERWGGACLVGTCMCWMRQLALAKMALEDIQRTDHLFVHL